MNSTTQYGLQDCFKRAKQAIYNANIAGGMTPDQAHAEVQNAILSQSYLRLEQPVVASQTNIFFPILTNQQGGQSTIVRPTEIRLAQQDSFFVSNIAIYLALASSATDTTFEPQTSPNATVFTLGGAGVAGQPLMNFYNGYLSVTINKSVIVPAYPMMNFLQTPQTQQVAASPAARNQFDPSQVSLWEPNINFVGTKLSQINIAMPNGILTANLDANTYAIIVMQGVLAQNVTLMS